MRALKAIHSKALSAEKYFKQFGIAIANKELEVKQEVYKQETEILQQQLDSGKLNAEEERKVEAQLSDKKIEMARAVAAHKEAIRQFERERAQAAAEEQVAMAEKAEATQELNRAEAAEKIIRVQQTVAQKNLQILKKQLAEAKYGSVEQVQLIAQIAKAEADLAKLGASLRAAKIDQIRLELAEEKALADRKASLLEKAFLDENIVDKKIADKFKNKIQIEEEYIARRRALRDKIKQEEVKALEEEIEYYREGTRERVEAESQLAKLKLEIQKQALQDKKDDVERELSIVQVAIGKQIAAFEEANARQKYSKEQYINYISDLTQRGLNAEIAALRAKIEIATNGSLEQAKLERELAEKKLDLQRSQQQKSEQLLQAHLERMKQQAEAAKQSLQLNLGNLGVADTLAQGTSKFLGTIEQGLTQIQSALGNESATAEERNQLLTIAKELTSDLADYGVKIEESADSELTIQKAIAAIKLRQLELQREQLLSQLEQLKVSTEIARLETQSNINEAQAKLKSANLSPEERESLQSQVEFGNQKLELLDKELAAKQRGLELDIKALDNQKKLAETLSKIEQTQKDRQKQKPQKDNQNNNSKPGSLNENVSKPGENGSPLNGARDTARQEGNPNSGVTGQNSAVLEGLLQQLSNDSRLVSSGIAGLGNSLSAIQSGISSINSQISGLPGAIAASMPRPVPTPPPRSGR